MIKLLRDAPGRGVRFEARNYDGNFNATADLLLGVKEKRGKENNKELR
jgi:hypothetical protein